MFFFPDKNFIERVSCIGFTSFGSLLLKNRWFVVLKMFRDFGFVISWLRLSWSSSLGLSEDLEGKGMS